MDYCSTVWNPYTATLENKLEMVRRRAARFVLNRFHRTSSVGSMLVDLKWTTLAERPRASCQSCHVLQDSLHGLVAVDMPPSLTPKNQSTIEVKTPKHTYHIAGSTKECHRMVFFQRTARDWNTLREDIVIATSPASFKEALTVAKYIYIYI